MGDGLESLPNDIETLKAALIAHLKLQIEKLNRDRMARAQSAPRGFWTSWN